MLKARGPRRGRAPGGAAGVHVRDRALRRRGARPERFSSPAHPRHVRLCCYIAVVASPRPLRSSDFKKTALGGTLGEPPPVGLVATRRPRGVVLFSFGGTVGLVGLFRRRWMRPRLCLGFRSESEKVCRRVASFEHLWHRRRRDAGPRVDLPDGRLLAVKGAGFSHHARVERPKRSNVRPRFVVSNLALWRPGSAGAVVGRGADGRLEIHRGPFGLPGPVPPGGVRSVSTCLRRVRPTVKMAPPLLATEAVLPAKETCAQFRRAASRGRRAWPAKTACGRRCH
mmetsp:Transcript_25246/g.86574  ORF Transcript_25246/g.86574 Transcript_25246/m.86574 type:complete len:283 (+) Transcript_25246:1952-2800(+)